MADGLPSVFAHALSRLLPTPPEHLAVAVSGGSDSLALVLLAHAALPGRVTALTVDHGLRREAAEEAWQVGRWLAMRGIPHHILRWDAAPATGIQEAARAARYALMGAWCRAQAVPVLLTGHTADDQAETLLARLARGAGLAGMAGIRALRPLDAAVTLARPLLELRRATLQAWLESIGQPWVSDPSNHDPKFERVRWRAALANLPELDAAAAARTASHLADLDAQLNTATDHWLQHHATLLPGGAMQVALAGAPLPEIRLRALVRALEIVTGSVPAREDVAAAIARKSATTCGGAKLEPTDTGMLCMREAGRIADSLPTPCARALWDRRFAITEARPGVVRALGEAGWRNALDQWPDLRGLAMPFGVRCALPALWRGEELLALGGGGNALATLLPASAQLDAEFVGMANMRHSPSLFLYHTTIS